MPGYLAGKGVPQYTTLDRLDPICDLRDMMALVKYKGFRG